MKVKDKAGTLALVAGLVVVSAAAVRADSVVGAAADARLPADRSCIQFDYGRATNVCSAATSRLVTIAPSGSFLSTSKTFFASGNSYATCEALVVDGYGNAKSWTGQKTLGSGLTTLGTQLGTLSFGAYDHAVVECNLGGNGPTYGGSVYSVSW